MDEKIKNIIDFAIGKEAESAALYTKASQMSSNPSTIKAFEEMAQMELAHKQKLKNLSQEDIAGFSVQNISNLRIADYMVDEKIQPDMNFREILVAAIKNEEKARKLYSDLAQSANDPEIKTIFELLAQEESKHKLNLETEYDENVLVDN